MMSKNNFCPSREKNLSFLLFFLKIVKLTTVPNFVKTWLQLWEILLDTERQLTKHHQLGLQ